MCRSGSPTNKDPDKQALIRFLALISAYKVFRGAPQQTKSDFVLGLHYKLKNGFAFKVPLRN